MKQWHPLFAKLLRPVVEGYYEIQTNVPVGDVPREADLVLLRRIGTGALPFQGLWKYLTPWNVLEFKGPTVSARVGHLDRLMELGLGIHRRFNEARAKVRRSPIEREQISFWYLANRLGKRFLDGAAELLGPLEPAGVGVWRCRVLRHLVLLVSGRDLPVDEESLPFHILEKEPSESESAVARLLAANPRLWASFGLWATALHPKIHEEITAMARTKGPRFYAKPLLEIAANKEEFTREVLEYIGTSEKLRHIELETLLSRLTPAERKKLKKRLQEEPD